MFIILLRKEEYLFDYLVNLPEEVIFNIMNFEEIDPDFVSNVV